MFRSFIPFILASLGFALISMATKMPLFEWQFSEVITDFQSACDGTLPSQWTTRFGEDLELRNRPSILQNLNIVVRRSSNNETLDSLLLGLYGSRQLLFLGVILSISYMWWFLFQGPQDRASSVVRAVFLTVIAVFMCFLLSQVVRLGGPAVGQLTYYSEVRHCQGAVSFSAGLSKIHYATLMVLLTSILLEVGALGVMLHQIRKTLSERNR